MIYPHAGNNSIQNVSIVFDWNAELNSKEIKAIQEELHPHLEAKFPIYQLHQLIQINVGGAFSTPNNSEIGGFVYAESNTNGISNKSLNFTRQSLVVSVNEYSSWKDFLAIVELPLQHILPLIFKSRGIIGIGLQYSDLFNWRDAREEFSAASLFSPDTKFLPKNAIEHNNLWHSHHGFLSIQDSPVQFDLIENVNVNVINNNGLSVQIITSHKATLMDAIWSNNREESTITTILNNMHDSNKGIFKNLLTSEVQESIGLNK
ncbi:MAG: TIGR04255 family protein [Phormidesmis sp. FL-bin-119]|nr:TIGR04255 family protein [Pedobacter sp.]